LFERNLRKYKDGVLIITIHSVNAQVGKPSKPVKRLRTLSGMVLRRGCESVSDEGLDVRTPVFQAATDTGCFRACALPAPVHQSVTRDAQDLADFGSGE
jgi:hypothetical protein